MSNKISEMKPGDIIEFNKPKKYEFIKELMPGGTGKTILMRDPILDIKFVCKKYNPVQTEYWDEFYKRFIDEIKLMYSVYHNNIVRIYDYVLYPDLKLGYITMEYIQGIDVEEYFAFHEEGKINSIFNQLITAFSYLEKEGILHRDIRAQNVIIDNNDTLKVIDFGFGKKVCEEKEERASVLLNWPASKIPDEIVKNEIYNEKTEIFYVGYLIKNIIEKYEIKSFRYVSLLDKMIEVNSDKRIESFEAIQKEMAEQEFDNIKFSNNEKKIYQSFADNICCAIKNLTCKIELEENERVIIEKLKSIVRANSLERYITDISEVISCFIKSNYVYFQKNIEVSVLVEFFEFFSRQPLNLKQVILDNLYGRLKRIEVVEGLWDGELPFN